MRIRVSSILLGVIALGGTFLLSTSQAEACSRTYLVFFIEPGLTSVSPRGDQALEEFVRFFSDQRPSDPTGPVSTCGPLPPGDWKVVVAAHADDPGARDQCALSLARGLA